LVIATNQSYKQIEMERGHVPAEKIAIVRNGPDLHELASTSQDLELRKRARIIIGYVGVMGVQDGVDNLLRALQKLICHFDQSDFLCVLLGSGAAVPGLHKMTMEMKLSEHVYFTGWISKQADVARYINSMDICVAPEPSDPYNDRSTAAKIMEYMTFSKPIVAFDLPEHRYTAQNAALYAKPNDVTDLAQNISVLIDSLKLRLDLGNNGRERLVNTLAWSHQEVVLVESYKQLIRRK
jgi:glycosyltransferase involved in cell wall biosynthesis